MAFNESDWMYRPSDYKTKEELRKEYESWVKGTVVPNVAEHIEGRLPDETEKEDVAPDTKYYIAGEEISKKEWELRQRDLEKIKNLDSEPKTLRFDVADLPSKGRYYNYPPTGYGKAPVEEPEYEYYIDWKEVSKEEYERRKGETWYDNNGVPHNPNSHKIPKTKAATKAGSTKSGLSKMFSNSFYGAIGSDSFKFSNMSTASDILRNYEKLYEEGMNWETARAYAPPTLTEEEWLENKKAKAEKKAKLEMLQNQNPIDNMQHTDYIGLIKSGPGQGYRKYTEKEWNEKHPELNKRWTSSGTDIGKKAYPIQEESEHWWREEDQQNRDISNAYKEWIEHGNYKREENLDKEKIKKLQSELNRTKERLTESNRNSARLQDELVTHMRASAKLTTENMNLRKRIELLEMDPEEYKRRMAVDPYGEENWEN